MKHVLYIFVITNYSNSLNSNSSQLLLINNSNLDSHEKNTQFEKILDKINCLDSNFNQTNIKKQINSIKNLNKLIFPFIIIVNIIFFLWHIVNIIYTSCLNIPETIILFSINTIFFLLNFLVNINVKYFKCFSSYLNKILFLYIINFLFYFQFLIEMIYIFNKGNESTVEKYTIHMFLDFFMIIFLIIIFFIKFTKIQEITNKITKTIKKLEEKENTESFEIKNLLEEIQKYNQLK
jgi:hypothetical protein